MENMNLKILNGGTRNHTIIRLSWHKKRCMLTKVRGGDQKIKKKNLKCEQDLIKIVDCNSKLERK